MHKLKLDIEVFDNDFLLIRSTDRSLLRKLGKAIYRSSFTFVSEVVVSEREICLQLKPSFSKVDIEKITTLDIKEEEFPESYKLPVYFGENHDWQLVEKYTGMTKTDVITKLLGTVVEVSMFGFLPGFIYAEGIDAQFHIPRKTVPTKRVAGGSVAIGGKYFGVYAIDSPGGWNVIGKTPISLINLRGLPPSELNIGDSLELIEIGSETYEELLEKKVNLGYYNKKR